MKNTENNILSNYNFDSDTFENLRQRFISGSFTDANNIISGKIEPPDMHCLFDLKKIDEDTKQKYFADGKSAIENKELGVIIVNGGMATRFGGVVKGIVEVYDGKSFLQIKLEQIKKVMEKYKIPIKIYIMNSFATEPATVKYLKKHNFWGIDKSNIYFFNQFIFKRIKSNGEYFKSSQKIENNFYGPGHGDFIFALKKSGLLDEFIKTGGNYLWYSNVDNLGATIDEIILGVHIEKNKQMTVELAEKIKGDKGGAPAKVDARIQLVEGFKFPPEFNQDSIPVFNTATYIFNASALLKDIQLPWYIVRKKVEGEEIIQFERLAGDLSIFFDTNYLIVSRDERFFPVKTKEDLDLLREKLKKKFG